MKTLQSLLKQYTFDEILPYFQELYRKNEPEQAEHLNWEGYRKIYQSLQDLGTACISNHSTGDRRSLFVVLDKEHQVSDEDWQNMAIRDIERKYDIRIL